MVTFIVLCDLSGLFGHSEEKASSKFSKKLKQISKKLDILATSSQFYFTKKLIILNLLGRISIPLYSESSDLS